ncbi:uncharacterized protein PV07_00921 [Cladophialophora immunda]|uniref:Xylanolytic transcriptional activator regulatory domain-containing protein n=1 Tax=Cladophialophora immunda TaxID=569365 RepID=A0A0D2CW90_9EURO|nr:uncharacterized protein PV07_00921 [Cladophialophora immunda]KIW34125.1 hypothetical protein PV07_00921 [Cladophialophora immunda]
MRDTFDTTDEICFDLFDPLMGLDADQFLVSAELLPEHAVDFGSNLPSESSSLARGRDWPSQAASTRERPPPDVHSNRTELSGPTVTDAVRSIMLKDLSIRFSSESSKLYIPSTTSLDKCIKAYLNAFHIHLPLFHIPSLDLEKTPAPLILAICSIGALYRLERRVAASLYRTAEQALSVEDNELLHLIGHSRFLEDCVNPTTTSQAESLHPLWLSQTRLLLTFFATFTGSPAVVRTAVERVGWLTNDYRARLKLVKVGDARSRLTSWSAWVEREKTKRLLCGIFVFTNLLTITYGLPAAFNVVQDVDIEMPSDEIRWNASSESGWRKAIGSKDIGQSMTIRGAVSLLVSGETLTRFPDEWRSWSPFATLVTMHAVAVQIWHRSQGTILWADNAVTDVEGMDNPLTARLQTEAALARCRQMLLQSRNEHEFAWSEAEGPFLFNCFAILRVSYCRSCTSLSSIDPTLLLKGDATEVMDILRSHVTKPQRRDDLTTNAVARALDGFLVPVRAGTLLIRKTAALTWSIEHVLASWDSSLLVTKWVHAMDMRQKRDDPLNSSERRLIQRLKELLAEADVLVSSETSLAAELARWRATFYTDTWVWSVCPRMGWVLLQLANVYEEASCA